ncbi:MAG: tRNA guanosine(34) transglycosylase Tgt [Vampirovibrionales bacterium]|nr:tRNA guanosine(34) transglycosylase Tgt [Vampirovibrionales bacterium]
MDQPPSFEFQLQAAVATPWGEARAAALRTPHGVIHTPAFMPVGTHGAVKALTWPQLRDTGAEIVLANAFHLYLRPGHEAIARAGGLHGWMNWQAPILTDSGGFQAFSLAKIREVTDDGVRFQDPRNGDTHFLGPRESMAIQNALGADIIMAFDECPPANASREYVAASLDKTHRWLAACVTHHARPAEQALFPIVQGGLFEELRAESAVFASQFAGCGVAIGGVSVGESREDVNRIVAHTAPLLPRDKARYLMGVGTPQDLLCAIARGIDMFDCVMPTRIARHGSFFSAQGRRILKNAEFAEDPGPLEAGCDCYTCRHHSRAYVQHLIRLGEWTAFTLISIHNIAFLVRLAQDARAAILAGTFDAFFERHMTGLRDPSCE